LSWGGRLGWGRGLSDDRMGLARIRNLRILHTRTILPVMSTHIRSVKISITSMKHTYKATWVRSVQICGADCALLYLESRRTGPV